MPFEKFAEALKNQPGFVQKYGELGPVYGVQWRQWPSGKKTIDQLGWAIEKNQNLSSEKTLHYFRLECRLYLRNVRQPPRLNGHCSLPYDVPHQHYRR